MVRGTTIKMALLNLQAIKEFVELDPYFTAGLVDSYSIKPWNIVVQADQKYLHF